MSLRVSARLASIPVGPLPPTARPLMLALEARGLAEHGLGVAALAAEVSRRLGMGHAAAHTITRAALLHDVGKLAIPAAILDRPGPLAPHEVDALHEHPVIGERMLQRSPGLEGLAPLVRHSHERWDGHGYPDGLRGRGIPLGARIIAACDAWDAMRADRVYRPALGRDAAIATLVAEDGHQFDGAVVTALVTVVVREGLS